MTNFLKSGLVAALLLVAGTLSSQATTVPVGCTGAGCAVDDTGSLLGITQPTTVTFDVTALFPQDMSLLVNGSPVALSITAIVSGAVFDVAASFTVSSVSVFDIAYTGFSYGGQFTYTNGTVSTPVTPIPGSLALFLGGLGLMGMFYLAKARRSDGLVSGQA
jgi:hypothetical protein